MRHDGGVTDSIQVSLSMSVDLRLTPMEAVRRVAYHLSDRFDVVMDQGGDHEVVLQFRPLGPESGALTAADVRTLLTDFCLRVEIDEKTKDVRSLVLYTALAHARKRAS